MKKVIRVLIVIGLLGLAVAGISVLIRNNSSSSALVNSGGSSAESSKATISLIYTDSETIYF